MESIMMIVLLIAVMYFLMIRPENKRKKQQEAIRNSVEKGHIVTTIGGLVGKVVSVSDEKIVLETSEDRVRVEYYKWAIQKVDNPDAPPAAPAKSGGLFGRKKAEAEETAVPEEPVEEKVAEEPVAEAKAEEQ